MLSVSLSGSAKCNTTKGLSMEKIIYFLAKVMVISRDMIEIWESKSAIDVVFKGVSVTSVLIIHEYRLPPRLDKLNNFSRFVSNSSQW